MLHTIEQLEEQRKQTLNTQTNALDNGHIKVSEAYGRRINRIDAQIQELSKPDGIFLLRNACAFIYKVSPTLPLTITVIDEPTGNTAFELIEDITGEYLEIYVQSEFREQSPHINTFTSTHDIVQWAIDTTLFN